MAACKIAGSRLRLCLCQRTRGRQSHTQHSAADTLKPDPVFPGCTLCRHAACWDGGLDTRLVAVLLQVLVAVVDVVLVLVVVVEHSGRRVPLPPRVAGD